MDLQCYRYAYTYNVNDAIPMVDHSPPKSHCCLLSLSYNPDLNPTLEDVSFVMDLWTYNITLAATPLNLHVACRSPFWIMMSSASDSLLDFPHTLAL